MSQTNSHRCYFRTALKIENDSSPIINENIIIGGVTIGSDWNYEHTNPVTFTSNSVTAVGSTLNLWNSKAYIYGNEFKGYLETAGVQLVIRHQTNEFVGDCINGFEFTNLVNEGYITFSSNVVIGLHNPDLEINWETSSTDTDKLDALAEECGYPGGFATTPWTNNFTSADLNIISNTFSGNGTGIAVSVLELGNNLNISRNNFIGKTSAIELGIRVHTNQIISASNNYWGTTSMQEINSMVYDKLDNFNLGSVVVTNPASSQFDISSYAAPPTPTPVAPTPSPTPTPTTTPTLSPTATPSPTPTPTPTPTP